MKKLAIFAVLITSTVSAQDAAKSPQVTSGTPASTSTHISSQESKPTPVVTPVWVWDDMDASDLRNLDACAIELPKRLADPWIWRLSQHIKPAK